MIAPFDDREREALLNIENPINSRLVAQRRVARHIEFANGLNRVIYTMEDGIRCKQDPMENRLRAMVKCRLIIRAKSRELSRVGGSFSFWILHNTPMDLYTWYSQDAEEEIMDAIDDELESELVRLSENAKALLVDAESFKKATKRVEDYIFDTYQS